MVDTAEVRRHNLRRLVVEHEGVNNLARALGLTKGAYISQILSAKPHRSLSEKTARKWERTLGLPAQWLDTPTDAYGAATPVKAVNAALLAEAITIVMDALKAAKVTLSSAQIADLIVMQYTDAAPAGRVDRVRVDTIVGLLKR